MRTLKFITGHVIYNPAYTIQIPTENHLDQTKNIQNVSMCSGQL